MRDSCLLYLRIMHSSNSLPLPTGDEADYTFSDPLSLVFNNSLGTSVGCASISVVDDQIFEATENFIVIATCDTPRVSVTDNTSSVYIIDNDSVNVGFVELLVNVSEDVEIERSVTVCIELSGEIEKNVKVTIATESSNSPLGVATSSEFSKCPYQLSDACNLLLLQLS